MYLLHETKYLQETLGNFCLGRNAAEIELSRPEVLSHYKRLISNVFYSTLKSAFPISEEWLSTDEWNYLIAEFMAKHASQTPAVWKMPLEFAEFVIANDYAKTLNRPALNDLLYFEWVEIAVHTMTDTDEPKGRGSGFKPDSTLALNPYHQIIQLQYPVHKINANEAEKYKGDFYILVYRIIETGQVRFLELSVLHVVLLQLINNGSVSLNETMPHLIKQFNLNNHADVKEHLVNFCKDLLKKKILIIS